MKNFRKILTVIILITFLFPTVVFAQTTSSDQPTYLVQSGDTLDSIAYRFNISVDDLAKANGISEVDTISIGQSLIIPGLTGISGVLETVVVAFGQTLQSISQEYNIPASELITLNHLTSPSQLYAGSYLIVPAASSTSTTTALSQTIIQSNQSLLEAAVINNINPWSVALANSKTGSWDTLAGETLYYSSALSTRSAEMISPLLSDVSINPLPITQGDTVEVKLTSKLPGDFKGTLGDYTLKFIKEDDYNYVAFQGIYAMLDPGLYPIRLYGTFSNGMTFDFQQNVLIQDGNFVKDPPLTVPEDTVDPTVTAPEDNLMSSYTSKITQTRYWDGIFRAPVDEPICIESGYGDRRSLNGSDYIYFHSGIDYGVCANLNIYAPADGVVVYTGSLTVRGNTVVIDHGWGVYSGLYHQSKILVKVGDKVTKGEQIGVIGATGRVTGPHLHWDLFVDGIQADPLQWLATKYPY